MRVLGFVSDAVTWPGSNAGLDLVSVCALRDGWGHAERCYGRKDRLRAACAMVKGSEGVSEGARVSVPFPLRFGREKTLINVVAGRWRGFVPARSESIFGSIPRGGVVGVFFDFETGPCSV